MKPISRENSKHFSDPRRLTYTAATLVGLITLFVFLPAVWFEFLNWDDDRNILLNQSFRGLGLDQVSWAIRTYHLGVWQPLAWVLFGFQYVVGGLDHRVYHGFSIALHVINAVTLFFLARLLIQRAQSDPERPFNLTAATVGAALAAILFAVHPLRVEPVGWVSCQPYLPSAFFAMLSVILYVCGHEPGAGPRHRRKAVVAAFVCYLAALMFKAPAITLPVVLLLVDVFPLRRVRLLRGFDARQWAKAIAEKIPFFIAAVAAAYLALRAKDFNESRMPFSDWSADERLAQSAYGVLFYLWKTLFPTDLAAYYELPVSLSLSRWPFNIMAACVVFGSFALLALSRRAAGLVVAWFAYLMILAPNLGLVQISRQIAADRYAYLATIPLFIALGSMMALAVSRNGHIDRHRSKTLALSVGAAIIALVVLTRLHLQTWRDSVSLWRASVAANSACEHSHCELGQALAERSGRLTARESEKERRLILEEAAEHLREAIRLNDGFVFAQSNLGAVLLASGKLKEARSAYESALKHEAMFEDWELARIHAGLAIVLAFDGEKAEAWRHARQAQLRGLPRDEQERLIDALSN